ncbi:hypothetical protein BABINDRAFT_101781 [Babjeviella inositovora NRRL Y-12698]|uniref:Uncharacterized protein n=1 Tax=Babjeviella inositovora NRRL Y-12698 TaxID=984486 RepID=A0A1E3QHL1_9ASCO|nr:uncharacterized protein BABINDRAFT_101781 [Babjeviella inositovora NRRL Y-12698]ODQ77185.1 hypothetical protein BABINDRAFT_101781 [Babjeviella inositovora NRRL Y-12698]
MTFHELVDSLAKYPRNSRLQSDGSIGNLKIETQDSKISVQDLKCRFPCWIEIVSDLTFQLWDSIDLKLGGVNSWASAATFHRNYIYMITFTCLMSSTTIQMYPNAILWYK